MTNKPDDLMFWFNMWYHFFNSFKKPRKLPTTFGQYVWPSNSN